MIALFHGTTSSAAEFIAREGWLFQSPSDTVRSVALEYGQDPAAVFAHLQEHGRFAVEEDRGRYSSFSLDRLTAEHSWAQRAPEMRWEALWAVWHLNNPEVPYGGVVLPRAGAVWVFQQMRRYRPAIVELSISYDALLELGAKTDGFAHRTLPSARVLMGKGGIMPAGVAIPCPFRPSRSRITIRDIERDVPWTVLADLLAIDEEAFKRRDHLGEYGPNSSDGVPHRRAGETRPWWLSEFGRAPTAHPALTTRVAHVVLLGARGRSEHSW